MAAFGSARADRLSPLRPDTLWEVDLAPGNRAYADRDVMVIT
jgi:hypothetical protein